MKKTWPYILSLLCLSLACSAQKQQKSVPAEYEEDLSAVRLEREVSPEVQGSARQQPSHTIIFSTDSTTDHTVNASVEAALDSVAIMKKAKRYLDGFSIQVYAGRDRQEALTTRSEIAKKIRQETEDEFDILLAYNQPIFLVTAGRYFNKLAAQKDLVLIRRYFPKAILIPKKISTIPKASISPSPPR